VCIAVGVGLGLIEVSVWTGTQEVVSEHAIGPAYAFLSVAMSTILLVVPFASGYLHDHTGTYDYGSYVCSASALIGMACAVALYFIEPKLQNPSEVYRKYYVVKIAMRKKHGHALSNVGKRHSITVGEVPYLRKFIEKSKGQRVDDLLSEDQTEPKLLDAVRDYQAGGIQGTAVVGSSAPGTSTSLPSDFWSSMVSKEIEVQKIHDSQVDLMAELRSPFYQAHTSVGDLASLWANETDPNAKEEETTVVPLDNSDGEDNKDAGGEDFPQFIPGSG